MSQDKFFLCKLTASVLSRARAEQGGEAARSEAELLQERCPIPERTTQ